MKQYWAQIKDGIIRNIIVTDENTPLELFMEGYDHFLQVNPEIPGSPGTGWRFDGQTFCPPQEDQEEHVCVM